MMDDISVDTHLCIRCNKTIVGIGAYLNHRQRGCHVSLTIMSPPGGSSIGSPTRGSIVQSTEICARDVPDIPFLPDVPALPDFFSSLDLQRIAPIVEPVDPALDDREDDADLLRPPQGHTGGKWKPGSRPSIMQGLGSYRDPPRECSPERLPDIVEKIGCAPCGRIFRDKYTYQRHLESTLHRKRSLRNAQMMHDQDDLVESLQQGYKNVRTAVGSRISSRTRKSRSIPISGDPSALDVDSKIKKYQQRCSLCFQWFGDSRALKRHEREHRIGHGDVLSCSRCPETFSDERNFRTHLKTHKQHTSCCGSIFTTIKGYREHKERVHAAVREWLPCGRCTRKFRTSRALRDHICGEDQKKVSCLECDYVGSRRNLALHVKATHSKNFRYECSQCSYRAARHGQLWRHIKLHEGQKAYRCPYCDYSCAFVENLRVHILKGAKHKGLKVYPCGKCHFATNNATEARQHADSHQLRVDSE